MRKQNRRDFLRFLGRSGLSLSLGGLVLGLDSCNDNNSKDNTIAKMIEFPLKKISHSLNDEVKLAEGLEYHVLVRWGDSLSDKDSFGFNNDYTAFMPFDKENPTDGILWVNHEYLQELFVSGFNDEDRSKKSKDLVDKEMY